MRSRIVAPLALVGGALALWIGWGTYVRRTTERVPYETVTTLDDVELRRYPESVLVETTATNDVTAFRRLFRYISGANETRETVAATAPAGASSEKIAMTAPVRTVRESGEAVGTAAPVRTDRDGREVSMAFHLPAEYTPETAPTPTDPSVRLVVEPLRTVAVRRFSWYATDGRVSRERRKLLAELSDWNVEPRGDPVLLRYDDPWTPPFMRTNEVAVPVEY